MVWRATGLSRIPSPMARMDQDVKIVYGEWNSISLYRLDSKEAE